MSALHFIEATSAHLDVVAGWPASADACDLWAGGPVRPLGRALGHAG